MRLILQIDKLESGPKTGAFYASVAAEDDEGYLYGSAIDVDPHIAAKLALDNIDLTGEGL